ncbi:peptidoglycan/LPS O-acetylase OafA/YrhL [Flavimobilis soli]|uniref:Peptidoglycan/LPS O-acetylase OafA/YrhL n=2 Tax=Flavimobilis soli TaxID=442709 RepID=A0A2A9E987_9MICO|nr:peptidoglycan/LPS O-acetylase OafA/YrhL [Flavimobilis soli]
MELEATAVTEVAEAGDARSPEPHRRWIPGLDGLRAIAILLVLAFHLAPTAMPGGFVGVDVFFVISGFLITTGIVREHASTGRLALGTFWAKRARRLLPALSLVLAVGASAALVVGGDVRVDLDRQAFGAMTFSSNWVSIAGEDTYFAALSPQLFANLWSLAVEEQFYLLWPFVALLVLRFRRSWRPVGVLLGLSAAAASAVAMSVVWSPDTDPTRVYYGTDTHLFGLMLGVALAFWFARPAAERRGSPVRLPRPTVMAAAGLAAIAVLAAVLPWESAWTYRGGLLLASLGSAAVIAALLRGGTVHRWLESPVLVWVGRRSYGLYLWHWPVFVLLTQIFAKQYVEGTGVYLVWVLTIIVTFVLAGLSYRWVEVPVQKLGFAGAAQALGAWATTSAGAISQSAPVPLAAPQRRLRARGAALAALTSLAVVGAGVAIATAPSVSAIEEQIEKGIGVAFESAPTTLPPALTETPGAPASTEPGKAADPKVSATPSASPGASAEPSPERTEPAPLTGADVTIIGDSVTLASAEELAKVLPDAAIDAEVSRSMLAAPGIMANLEKKGRLRDVVVLSLATNTTLRRDQVADVMEAVGPERRVIFVNAYGARSWIKGTNKELARAAKDYPNVVVADWSGAISKKGEGLAADGVHPNPSGAKVYARVVLDAYTDLPR